MKFMSLSSLSCLEKVSSRAVAWQNWPARMRRLALCLSVAIGLFSGAGALAQTTYTVTTTADTTGSCSGSSCTTLRAALTAAGNSAGNTISLTGLSGTITLTSALPTIVKNLTITGPGANVLAISGNNAYQILDIPVEFLTVAISGLTFANGTAANGGAIDNGPYDTLTVTNCTFIGNSSGGAILNYGALTVIGSTFTGNSGGGAISNNGTSSLTVTNSTFFGNSAVDGGAIDNGPFSSLTATNNTFSSNTASNYGGAIDSNSSSVTASNNIFAGNSAGAAGGAGIIFYQIGGNASLRYNLFYQNLDAGGAEDDCNGCTNNTNAILGSNPLLATLANNGGPTQTMLPEPGSPAICVGSVALIPAGVTTDQRGFSRTTTYNGNTCLDLGAVQTGYTAVAFSNSSYSAIGNQAVNPAPVVTVTENGQNIGGVPITLAYSGTGSPTGLGPVTTVGGAGATFSSLEASSGASGTLSVSLPITASVNSIQPPALTASAMLNIQSRAQTITFVVSSPLTYGTAPITLTATGGGSGNPVTFSLDAASTAGAASLSGTNKSTLTINGVGNIVIDANQAAGNGYSAAAQVQQSIMVNPASMAITASSPSVTYGSAVPTITPIFGTFYNGDTSAVLTRQPTCTTAYTTTSAAGSSPSTSCTGASAANYTFTYINGSVTVTPAPTFVVAGTTSSLAIAPGATTGNTVPITITPANGFTGTVTLTCTITPVATSDPPTCSLSPTSVTITGAAAQTATLTITTTAASAQNRFKGLLWPSTGTALAMLLMIGVPRKRCNWTAMLVLLVFSVALGVIGCGGSSNPGTTAGTYSVTVTGTSGNTTGTVGTIALTVQ